MTNHQKRLSAPTSWPVERKTAVFTVKAHGGPHGEAGVPLVVVLRDVLGYVDSTREAKYALNSGGVTVNGETPNSVQRPVGMFDILAFPARDEYYRVFPDEGGRLGLTPISEDAAGSKLAKITDKTSVSGDRTQLNLHDGANLLVDDATAYDAGDSIVVTPENEVVAHFEFEAGALVTAVDGSHAGEIGEIDERIVSPGSSPNMVRVETDDGSFETVEENVVVIDENFTDGAGDGADETEVTEE
ncbi:MAG: 30S ribosomal protein S4e [Halobacteriaceae archaeon]